MFQTIIKRFLSNSCIVNHLTGRHAIFLRCEQTVEGWMADYFKDKPLFELKGFTFMK